MIKKIFPALVCIFLLGCNGSGKNELKTGKWLAHLEVKDGKMLPFNFELTKENGVYSMNAFNAAEVVTIDEIEINKDSIQIKMPVFEGYIAGTFSETEINGSFIKESLDRIVPFRASFGDSPRFTRETAPEFNISGIWETTFNPGTQDSYSAKGIFTQNNSKVTGTFRTTTGDYRYLEGIMDGDSLKISTFDGAHAFLFMAKVSDDNLKGIFYSGNHSMEPFIARRNEGFELPDENSLTFIKEGYDRLEFAFPTAEGELVSLADDRFQNKVVVVQIMGTWCPNCLDETKFLTNYLQERSNRELEIVALAFEYAPTTEEAFKGIQRLRDRIGVEYPILLAQYGTSNKEEANKKLPMLNHILSYPTTIFVDKKGMVRRIHTGFNGPATGEKFTQFKTDFNDFLSMLLNE